MAKWSGIQCSTQNIFGGDWKWMNKTLEKNWKVLVHVAVQSPRKTNKSFSWKYRTLFPRGGLQVEAHGNVYEHKWSKDTVHSFVSNCIKSGWFFRWFDFRKLANFFALFLKTSRFSACKLALEFFLQLYFYFDSETEPQSVDWAPKWFVLQNPVLSHLSGFSVPFKITSKIQKFCF